MNLLIAPDSFKGSLSSDEVCDAIAKGAIIADPTINIKQIPSSDGGEGFCSSMIRLFGGEWVERNVTYPLGDKGNASFVYNRYINNAYVELASAAGLHLVSDEKRNIMTSTTYGVGELICEAVGLGAKTIVVGLGGSATNDGGIGMLAAIGMRFYDIEGHELPPVPKSLGKVHCVDNTHMIDLSGVKFTAACDVKNPLCGQNGASFVFAKQKGASDKEIVVLDEALRSYAAALGIDPDVVGSGAAGGVGAALISVLSAEHVSGAELLVNSPEFKNALEWADVVITGEGNTDLQTYYGKLVSVVASSANKVGVPTVVLSGGLSDGYEKLREHGVSAFYSISDMGYDLDYCMKNADDLLTEKTFDIIKNI